MEPLELTPDEFLNELRAAPCWDTWQDYKNGTIGLQVYYGFGKSAYIVDMTKMDDAGKFYMDLMGLLATDSIRKARATV
jgi:hypothetical protein